MATSLKWETFFKIALAIAIVTVAVHRMFDVFEPFWDRLLPYRKEKDALYREVLASGPVYDRVFVGSSTTMMGIDPAVVDAVAGGRSFNAGQLGYSPPNLILDVVQELADAGKARTVVYGIDSWVGGARVADRRTVDAHGRSEHALWLSSVFRNRDVFFFWVQRLVAGHYISPDRAWVEQLRAGGRFAFFAEARLHRDGYLETFGLLDPDWPNYLKAVAVGSQQGETLRQIFALCRAEHLPLVVVRSPEFIRTYQEAAEGHRLLNEFLKEASVEYGFRILDYSVPGTFAHDQEGQFFDIHHLNTSGAATFSRMLGSALAGTPG